MVSVLLFLFWLIFPFVCGGSGFLSEVTGICLLAGGDMVVLGYVLVRKQRMEWTVPDLLVFALTVWGMVRLPWGSGMETLLSGMEWLGVMGLYMVVRQCRLHRVTWYGVALAGMIQVFTGGHYFPNPGPFLLVRGQKDYVLCLGRQLYKQERYREAIPVLKQAAALRPTTGMLCDLGDCYRRQGRYADAEYCFLLARDMIPARLTARYHLFCLYRETGRTEEACAMAREILQTKVKIVNSLTLDIKSEAREYLYRYKFPL